MPGPKIIRLMPDDVLLIGNVGELEHSSQHGFVERLREDIPTAKRIVLFEADIDVRLLREVESDD